MEFNELGSTMKFEVYHEMLYNLQRLTQNKRHEIPTKGVILLRDKTQHHKDFTSTVQLGDFQPPPPPPPP